MHYLKYGKFVQFRSFLLMTIFLEIAAQPTPSPPQYFSNVVSSLTSGQTVSFTTITKYEGAFGGYVNGFKYYEPQVALKSAQPAYFDFSYTRMARNKTGLVMQLMEGRMDDKGKASVTLTTLIPSQSLVLRKESWSCVLYSNSSDCVQFIGKPNQAISRVSGVIELRLRLMLADRIRFTVNYSLCSGGPKTNVTFGGEIKSFNNYPEDDDVVTEISIQELVTNEQGPGHIFDVFFAKIYTTGVVKMTTFKVGSSTFSPLPGHRYWYTCNMHPSEIDDVAVKVYAI